MMCVYLRPTRTRELNAEKKNTQKIFCGRDEGKETKNQTRRQRTTYPHKWAQTLLTSVENQVGISIGSMGGFPWPPIVSITSSIFYLFFLLSVKFMITEE